MSDGPAQVRLAIETSNPGACEDASRGASVALGGPDDAGTEACLGIEYLKGADAREDDLIAAIDRLVRGAGKRAPDIGSVAVSVGPGGYTAVRVAVAAAKMIALANRGKCVAVPSALVAAEGARAALDGAPFVVVLAGKGATAWLHPVGMGVEGYPSLGVEADLMRLLERGARIVLGDRFLPEPMRRIASDAGVPVIPPVFDAAACLRASRALPDVEPGQLVPVYPREPDAVRLWRERRSGE